MRDDQAGIGAMMSNMQFKTTTAKLLIGVFGLVTSFALIPVNGANAATSTTTCYYDIGGGSTLTAADASFSYSFSDIGGSSSCLSSITVSNDEPTLVGIQSVTGGTVESKYWNGTAFVSDPPPVGTNIDNVYWNGISYTTACNYSGDGSTLGSGTTTYRYVATDSCPTSVASPNTPIGTYSISDAGYWTGSTYKDNGDPCSIAGVSGSSSYRNGICTPPAPPSQSSSNIPPQDNKLNDLYSGSVNAPSGGKPMCSSGALVTGAAIFGVVLAGAVCEANAIAGSSQVYSYDTSSGGRSSGVNAYAMWARGTITAEGKITSGDGAQLISNDGNSGLIVDNNTVYMTANGNNRSASIYLDTGSTSNVGVGITGSTEAYAATAYNPNTAVNPPSWADVLISSASYSANAKHLGDPLDEDYLSNPIDFEAKFNATRGSAIIVTDFGIQILTPSPSAGNKITNTMNANYGAGNVTNDYGGGTGATTNNFGNGNSNTSINMTAANALQVMQSGSMYSTLGTSDPADTGESSGLSVLQPTAANPNVGGTSAATTTVLRGTAGPRTIIDQNGKMTIVSTLPDDPRDQTSSAMTVTNGYGNIHGFMVNETQAVMSGGTNSTTFVLDNDGATFSNSATGGPVQVHGVYDGTMQFDAVNVRQLYGAVAASMATVPNFTVEPGETGIGFGTAMMGSYPAIGMAFAKKNKNGSQINVGVAAAEHVPLAVRAGVGWVW